MIIKYTSQFKKDYKRIKKQNKKLSKLQELIRKLLNEEKLESKYKDHALTGDLKGYRDCHLGPNWLIIYKVTREELILERTGSLSVLFK